MKLNLQNTAKIDGKYSAKISDHENWLIHIDVDSLEYPGFISIHTETWHAIAKVSEEILLDAETKEVRAEIVYTYASTGRPLWPKTSLLQLITSNNDQPANQNIELIISHPERGTFEKYLKFEIKTYDKISLRIDAEKSAQPVFTQYERYKKDTSPPKLEEVWDIRSVFENVGFDVDIDPDGPVTPLISASFASSGLKKDWSNQEMHNAMVHYWKNTSEIGPWSMWVFYAAMHEKGPQVGGIMFDNIGEKQRQGAAIFTKSDFNNDIETGLDVATEISTRSRRQFFTATHEIGHGLNLNHSWRKSFDQPWMKLVNNKHALSFMNYPKNNYLFFRVFEFKFSEAEIFFMRHAPRDFVRPGGSLRSINHGLIHSDDKSHFSLEISTSKGSTVHKFMEPVKVNIKLRNDSHSPIQINEEAFRNGQDVGVYIQRNEGPIKKWRPMELVNSNYPQKMIKSGESISSSFFVSFSTDGWIIDEPGNYQIQTVFNIEENLIFSNILNIRVEQGTPDEVIFAGQYFTEDVARTLYFQGAPSLLKANETLNDFVKLSADNDAFDLGAAAFYADIALSDPLTRDFKFLNFENGLQNNPKTISIKPKDISAVSNIYAKWLSNDPKMTFDHIRFDSDEIIDTTWESLKDMQIDPDQFKAIEEQLIRQKK